MHTQKRKIVKSGKLQQIFPQELEPKVLHSAAKTCRDMFVISVTLDSCSCNLSRTKLQILF